MACPTGVPKTMIPWDSTLSSWLPSTLRCGIKVRHDPATVPIFSYCSRFQNECFALVHTISCVAPSELSFPLVTVVGTRAGNVDWILDDSASLKARLSVWALSSNTSLICDFHYLHNRILQPHSCRGIVGGFQCARSGDTKVVSMAN